MAGLIWSVVVLAALVGLVIAICPSRHDDKTVRRR